MKKKNLPPVAVQRVSPSPEEGLSLSAVREREEAGLTNRVPDKGTRSYGRILLDNVCTFFNLIWLILFGINLFIFCQGKTDIGHLFFIGVILANTALAVIQEIAAKRQVEKLSLVTVPRVTVIREGEESLVSPEELVLDDVAVFTAGNQIPADAVLLSGRVEMNESLLTGESDAVKKEEGDALLAGSFVIAGACRARIDKIGADSYIQTIAKAAKTFKSPKSDLFRDIGRFVRIIGICIPPFAALMFLNNWFASGGDIYETLLSTTGSVQGMIPAGMFLLITVALSAGVVKLSRKKTLVRDIYSVEMLSRTDTLCLDKTGTITDGTMEVAGEVQLLDGHDIASAVYGIMKTQTSQNFTSVALTAHYTEGTLPAAVHEIPFSSKRKFTAAVFPGVGTYAVGAPGFLSTGAPSAALSSQIDAFAAEGKRVLMLAYSPEETESDELPAMTPVALILLVDHIRPEAPDTIRWFRENGVSVRIISGDNPVTVAAIAKRVGVENAEECVSLEGMTLDEVAEIADRYTVFGRVTPEQKHTLVKALKAAGHTVSMTGDGVNDTLALKEADCSIAMADGSDVARNLSKIVLQENNFACLPAVVCEGRQVVNNVQRAASLFLMKTFAVILLSVGCVIFRLQYPFETNMLTMHEVFVNGLPSVILALEPNSSRIEGSFLKSILKRSIPDALLIVLATVTAMTLHYGFGLFPNPAEYATLLTLSLTVAGFLNLVFLCFPMNRIRLATIGFSLVGLTLCVVLLGTSFGAAAVTGPVLLALGGIALALIPLHFLLHFLWQRLIALPVWGTLGARIRGLFKKKTA